MEQERGSLFRKALHIASPALLVYYALPDDLGIGFPKALLAFLLWVGTLVVEVLRLVFDIDIIGLREYEKRQVSAYFWGGTALTLGLLLFPMPFVVVALCGMAWVDPLCSLSRERGGYPLFPLAAYATIAMVAIWVLTGREVTEVVIIGLFAAALAIGAEYPNIASMDDDFTMQIVPLLGMTMLDYLIQYL